MLVKLNQKKNDRESGTYLETKNPAGGINLLAGATLESIAAVFIHSQNRDLAERT